MTTQLTNNKYPAIFQETYKLLVLTSLIVFYFLNGILSEYNQVPLTILMVSGLVLAVTTNIRKIPRELSTFFFLGLAFVLYIIIHASATGRAEYLFKFQYSNITTFIAYAPVFYAIYKANFTRDQLIKILIIGGLFSIYYSAYLIIESPKRGGPEFPLPIIIGNLGMISGLIALAFFIGIKSRLWKSISAIIFLSGVLLSLLSGSRGGWGALIISIITIFYLFVRRKKIPAAYLYALIPVLLILVFSAWHLSPMGERIALIYYDIEKYIDGDPRSSLGLRFEMWKVSVSMFMDNPLLGQGIDSFRDTWIKYLNSPETLLLSATNRHLLYGHPHNDFLLVASQTGLIGLILFLSWIIYPLKKSIDYLKNDKSSLSYAPALAGIILVESFMEFMLSNHAIFTRHLFEYFVMTASMILIILSTRETDT